ITPANLEITADNQVKTYGDVIAFVGNEFTITDGQLFFSDSLDSATLSSTGSGALASVGDYSIDISNAVGSGLSNYNITYVPGTLTVDPALLTIMAQDQSKTYGDTFNFAGTEFTTSGLVNSDSVSSVSLTSTGAPATANVGSYDIDASNASGSGLSNYTISYVSGTLDVNPADLTITADNQVKTYGDTFNFTGSEFSTSGLLNSDSVSSVTLTSTGAPNTANVGSYDIDASSASGSGLSNYNISYVSGTLDVNPADLTITANNDSKVYDAVGYTGGNGVVYSGFVNGEDDSVLSGTLAFGGDSQGATNVGSYTIEASGLSSGNYNIAYVDGSLDITPADLTITADNQFKTYGDTFTFVGDEFSSVGLLGSDSISTVSLTSTGAP
ncbi:MAG: MBG domain-containing protein, partial [Pseudomonadota bacterium]|nr:MBG domain-containing protein [Pseudomonadota bacterium]